MKLRLMTGWLEIGAGFQLLLAAIVTYAQRDSVGIFGLTGSMSVFGCTLMIMAASAVFLLHPTRNLRVIRTGLFLFSGFLAAAGASWLLSAGNFGLAALQFGYAAWLLGASLLPSFDQRIASTDDVTLMTSRQLEIHSYERYIEVVVWVSIAFASAFISLFVSFDAKLFFSAIVLIAVSVQYFYRLRSAKSTTELRYLQALITLGVFTLMLIASTGGALGPLMYMAFLVIFAGAFVVKPLWSLLISIFYASYVLVEMLVHLYVHHDVVPDGHLVSFIFIAGTLLLTGFFVSLTGYRRRAVESSLVVSNRRLAASLSDAIKGRERSEEQAHDLRVLNDSLKEARSSLVNLLEDLEESKSEIEAASGLNVAVFKALAEGVVAAGKDGLVFRCNPVAAGIIGAPVDKIIGRRLADLMRLYREGRSELVDPLVSVEARVGHIVAFGDNLVLKRADKSDVPIEGKASAIMDGDNRGIGIVVAMRDATIERANDKMKSDFISIASHQLRTPISAIRWLLDMLLAGDAGRVSTKQKEFLMDVYSSVVRMAGLIDDLLNISRIESGMINPKYVPITTAAFVEGLVREFKPIAASQDMDFKSEVDETAGVFSSDPMLAHQVISNLLSNAFKYTPAKGSVSLRVHADGQETVFMVKDTGLGIPKSEQIRIFEKFFRASNVTSIDTAGSGLGLYVARLITGLLGGRIWFESDEKNGTAFYVALGGGLAALPRVSDSGKMSA